MHDYFIGVDIGSSGGVVVLDNQGEFVKTFKNPSDWRGWKKELEFLEGKKCVAVAEHVTGSGPNGASRNFVFGGTAMLTRVMFEMSGIEYVTVHPTKWMKHFMYVRASGDKNHKNKLQAIAEGLFPNVKMFKWNADAFLMAVYCFENHKE